MLIRSVNLRDFRSWAAARFDIGPQLTVVAGPNGSGKTNLLEGIYFGCTGRSCRTSQERRVIGHGAPVARVELEVDADGTAHHLSVALERGKTKVSKVDGAQVESIASSESRPLVIVFMPDRLSIITGEPSGRRAHLDQLATALYPARADLRQSYNRILSQRNALISAARSGSSSIESLDAWDSQLAKAGCELTLARSAAIGAVGKEASAIADELGLSGCLSVDYRASTAVDGEDAFLADLLSRRTTDLERGFTTAGPHRDDLRFTRDSRDLRHEGSQGEKRLALLALLLAERKAIGESRSHSPLLLLDDVMSELDARRRSLLTERVVGDGQCLITATEFAHVPQVGSSAPLLLPIGEPPPGDQLMAA